MITLVRSGCFRRFLPYRRRKRAVFAILGLTGLFLILYFENSAIERQQATSLDVEKRSKQELRDGLLAIGILTSNEHYRDNSNRNSDHDRTNFVLRNSCAWKGHPLELRATNMQRINRLEAATSATNIYVLAITTER